MDAVVGAQTAIPLSGVDTTRDRDRSNNRRALAGSLTACAP